MALSLAVVLYEGRRLSLALQAAVSAMVTACVQKQIDSSQSGSMALPSPPLAPGKAPTSPQGAAQMPLCLLSTRLQLSMKQVRTPQELNSKLELWIVVFQMSVAGALAHLLAQVGWCQYCIQAAPTIGPSLSYIRAFCRSATPRQL